jgi:glycosyltransferase involved in cell wall biosynthesis
MPSTTASLEGPAPPPGGAAHRDLVFLLPGDLDIATGGYRYDRRIVAGLREAGWTVRVQALDTSFPFPTPQALAQAAAAIAALPDGTLVLADGLAFGALPQVAQQHAQRLRWVALVHHPLALETGLGAADRERLFDSERRALAAARRVVVTSAATARGLDAYGVPAARIRVVEPGTDRAPLAASAATDAAAAGSTASPATASATTPATRPHGLHLLCVATVTTRKGHAVLIDALAGLQDRPWTLHCVGSLSRDEAAVQAVHAAIARHGLGGRVHLHGEVEEAALPALYAQADAFVLPSFFEGYGMVLAEALARGLPIVSTTGGAIPDTVPPEAGVLLPPGDVPALRDALARLMDDAAWRARLAAGARAARARLPTWPDAVARFASLLAEPDLHAPRLPETLSSP